MSIAPALPLGVPAPPTPLSPIEDSLVSWASWVTLMGFVGLVVLALVGAGPAARRIGPATTAAVTGRLARAAAVLGLLAAPAAVTGLAHAASQSGRYDYAVAWHSLYDGSAAGLLAGLEVTFSIVGALLILPLALRRSIGGAARRGLLVGGLGCGAVALGTTKFPDETPEDWGRTVVETVMWMLHLFGGAVWIGGLAGLVLLAVPGAVPAPSRAPFWSHTIRRFSATAMSCVTAILLSGLFLYWEHVDGPTQLLTTLYGRVLGVKLIIFGTMLLLGMVNQFWLHPRIEALRAAGDERPLHTILVRRFPALVAVELVLGLTVLFVAPFLHGSARNQAFQAEAAKHVSSVADIPKIAAKQASASTWAWGVIETVVVIAVMIAGYVVSGRVARARAERAGIATEPDQLVDA